MRHSKKSQYKDIAARVIYLLLFPGTKYFFVFHCPKKAVRDYFRQHMHGTYDKTKAAVEELKKQNLHPCLFVLEEVETTKVLAYRYVVVWTKILSEAGYVGLDQGNVSVYKDNLLDENVVLYNARKDTDLSKILTCEHCIVKIYSHSHCKFAPDYVEKNESASKQKKRNHEKIQLSIRISSGEHEQIKMNAQACGQSVSEYVKQNALSMQMIKPDQSVISENTAQLHEQRMAVMQLIYTIMKTETYVPADLEYILEKTKEMLKQQTVFLEEFKEHTKKDIKRMKKEVREIVKQRIHASNGKQGKK